MVQICNPLPSHSGHAHINHIGTHWITTMLLRLTGDMSLNVFLYNTILKCTRMIDNNNHVVVLRLIVSHITVQLSFPARRGESSLSWPLSFMCLEGVCAATDSELHQITYWVDNLMHFNMVLLKGFDPSFPPWKGSVLASRRQEHIWYPIVVTIHWPTAYQAVALPLS